jgi:hypothetical protein
VEEWEPPELKYGDGGDGDGEGTPSRRRRKLELELALAPDRGLDAQLVLVPDRGLDELAVKRLECGQETPVLHAMEAAASARAATNRQQALDDGDHEAGYAAGR